MTSKLYPASIELAEDQTPPIFMIALGTGIAPMRALIQERAAAKKRGEKVGPMTLMFGSRFEKKDYLYKEELLRYKEEGILNNLITAFSRDQAHKIYVQHRCDENQELIFDYLYKKKGYFYLCGIGGPENAVKASIKNAIKKYGKLTDKEADDWELRMIKEGRYNFETW